MGKGFVGVMGGFIMKKGVLGSFIMRKGIMGSFIIRKVIMRNFTGVIVTKINTPEQDAFCSEALDENASVLRKVWNILFGRTNVGVLHVSVTRREQTGLS
jgi:hypothetical protein